MHVSINSAYDQQPRNFLTYFSEPCCNRNAQICTQANQHLVQFDYTFFTIIEKFGTNVFCRIQNGQFLCGLSSSFQKHVLETNLWRCARWYFDADSAATGRSFSITFGFFKLFWTYFPGLTKRRVEFDLLIFLGVKCCATQKLLQVINMNKNNVSVNRLHGPWNISKQPRDAGNIFGKCLRWKLKVRNSWNDVALLLKLETSA